MAERVRARAFAAGLADLIVGVVVSNGVTGPVASSVRARLWASVTDTEAVEAA